MPTTRRKLLLSAAGTTVAALTTRSWAQEYPNRTIRIIVALPVGSGLDVDARYWAAGLAAALGQSVVVENRPGGATTLGTSLAAKAPPDGYTLLMGIPSSLCYMHELYTKLPYKPSDFDPVSQLSALRGAIMAHPSLPASNVAELIALAKAKPKSILAATQGVGGFQHLLGEWFGAATGTSYMFIPYNTSSPYGALLGGEAQIIFDALPGAMASIRNGRLKVLAVTGSSRHPLLPNVATFAEQGITDYDSSTWFGLVAPAGTPKPIVERVAAACRTLARSPEAVQRYFDYGGEPVGSSPAEFGAFMQSEVNKWVPVVKRSGIKLDI